MRPQLKRLRTAVGSSVGEAVGSSVGAGVGSSVGEDVGYAVGSAVGLAVGYCRSANVRPRSPIHEAPAPHVDPPHRWPDIEYLPSSAAAWATRWARPWGRRWAPPWGTRSGSPSGSPWAPPSAPVTSRDKGQRSISRFGMRVWKLSRTSVG
jgi:hypothetical protein